MFATLNAIAACAALIMWLTDTNADRETSRTYLVVAVLNTLAYFGGTPS